VLILSANTSGLVFFWPVGLPGEDGRPNAWNESSMEAADRAKTHWVRLRSNMDGGYYDVFVADGDLGEPEWPDKPMGELLRVALRGRFIDSFDHLVLRQLRGEVK
jgi:hypothetical protein